jgi:hypothetical protein
MIASAFLKSTIERNNRIDLNTKCKTIIFHKIKLKKIKKKKKSINF